jgi:hypothetical protein
VQPLVETSQTQPQQWRYTTDKPADNWNQMDFNDSAWSVGLGGFGTKGTPGAVIGTEWKSSEIWLRRTFELDAIPGESGLLLNIHHDEDAEVFLNGKLVKNCPVLPRPIR